MKIAVVILNWNGRHLLEKFLPSVVKNSPEANIYVADNASTDNSVAYIKNNFPTVKLILNQTNGGYAKGYNDALQQVNEPVFCLLNNDVAVTKNWLQPIILKFKTNANIAIMQPTILDYKNPDTYEYAGAAGGFIDKYGFPFCRGRIFNTLEKNTAIYKSSNIFWASGACFFIRKTVFNDLKGFDESFFAHMEEIDLCWRAYNKGFLVHFQAESTVFHLGGATLNKTNPKKVYLNFRNSLFTLTKNASGNIFKLILVRLFLDGFAGIYFLFQRKITATASIIKAHFSFYKNLNRLLKHRKENTKKSNYYYTNSIVWSYFIAKKKTFKQLK